jgi:hypothetical protein
MWLQVLLTCVASHCNLGYLRAFMGVVCCIVVQLLQVFVRHLGVLMQPPF